MESLGEVFQFSDFPTPVLDRCDLQTVSDIITWLSRNARFRLFALSFLGTVEFHQILNVFLASEEDRGTFVNLSWLNVKNPLGPRGGETSSLWEHVSEVLTL